MRTRKENLVVKLRRGVYFSLKLDVPENYRAALAGFYLGYGMEQIRTLVSSPLSDPEREVTISTALMLGLSDDDKIVQI